MKRNGLRAASRLPHQPAYCNEGVFLMTDEFHAGMIVRLLAPYPF